MVRIHIMLREDLGQFYIFSEQVRQIWRAFYYVKKGFLCKNENV